VDKAIAVPNAVATAVAATSKQSYDYDAPPNVTALIAEGEEVWDVLEDLRELPKDAPEQLIAWLKAIAEKLLGGGKPTRFKREAAAAQPAG
jgi:hypothetical protein